MSSLPQLGSFVFAEKLGRGSYATVYKAYRKGSKREVVAIKCVEKASLTKTAVDNLITEISILKKVKNEYIVELKDFEWDDKHIYLIMEYCSGGDLSRFIRERRRLPEVVVCRFLQQLATALKVLRSNNIAHMDLKPQNILLSDSQNPVLKLADFGFAQYLNPEDRATSLRGSPLYMAPEILLKQVYDARVDLWSVGIILYECLFGQAPFSSDTFSQLAEKIKSTKPIHIPYGVDVSDNCRDLLLSLLERDPDKRISFERFFAHPFVDLEHMPSPQSYRTGVRLIEEATRKDAEGDRDAAVRLYYRGLRYLVPLVAAETDRRRKSLLQRKVEEYMNRAEELKDLAETRAEKEVRREPSDELVRILSENPVLEDSVATAEEARRLAELGRYEESWDLYRRALEVMVASVKALPPGEKKSVLLREVDRWMRRAEDVKSLSTARKLRSQGIDESGQNCRIQ